MTIAERTLRIWRMDALKENRLFESCDSKGIDQTSHRREVNERILKLTQELLDILLLSRVKK